MKIKGKARLTAAVLVVGVLLQPVSVLAAPAAGEAQVAVNTSPASPDGADRVGPSVYLGAYLGAPPSESASIDAFESEVGKRLAIIEWGQSWAENGHLQRFPTGYFDAVRKRGSIPMIDWASWDAAGQTDQPAFELTAITNGAYDDYLRQWATAAKTWGYPMFLRFDHEMNGWWYPWGEQVNNNNPGDFVLAWQHVHDVFAQQGATNVTWVWCPNIVGRYSTPMEGLYPGDDYVDWTCMDGYNWGSDKGNSGWQTFSDVFLGSDYNDRHNTYAELLRVAPSKPIMIGETGSSENGGSKATWITNMFDVELPNNLPQVKALVWFNSNDNDPELTWSLSLSDGAVQAFAEGAASPSYASNGYGSLMVTPIPPPEYLQP